MKQNRFTIIYDILESSDLSSVEEEVLYHALEAAKAAYAPYSQFYVGAAARLTNGVIITGNNQENSAFPSGLCAERVLLFHLSSQNLLDQIELMAIRAFSPQRKINQPAFPCGACRDVIKECQLRRRKPWPLLLQGETGPIIRFLNPLEALFPFPFFLEDGSHFL